MCKWLILFFLMMSAPVMAEDDSIWLTDYEKAKALATALNRPILINFTGSDWCGWCVKLHKEVFAHDEFKDFAMSNLVLYEADFPRRKKVDAKVKAFNRTLFEKYGLRGYPSIVMTDADGKKLVKTGYKEGGPEAYVDHLQVFLDRFDYKPSAEAPKTVYADGKFFDLETAKVFAEVMQKPLLILFGQIDATKGPAKKLNDEVLTDRWVQQKMTDDFVTLFVDFSANAAKDPNMVKQNNSLRETFKIKRMPVALALNAEGKPLVRRPLDLRSGENFSKALTQALEANKP